ncbi:pilus assembly PilX N-terminal domain-containing protein [Shewanella eurypsychrophilus]|uniref:Pilus assembly PilX N-terminal domain-containing protein n=1 Tax=Shewanella eurypsychrophilus TaxID=2593656 RepID=A0ABX6V5I3_9GAMM|nr:MULTISPECIES: pilus assembly PilX N-terminal domain-containing protein [Shewanella]QFU21787.1 pilus assembly protein PilX [Shewanella sp. YLB-09]QPG57077.1 pilus assembly PilX N-terminal domain-containing protein [Shewanella eurypsychrophilus]
MKKQEGMVLFFSLIILIIMTVIGVALAVNSSQSMKMAGAGSERVEAMSAAQGAQDRVVANNQGATMANIAGTMVVVDAALGVTNTLNPLAAGDVNCQRSTKASSANLISCRRVEISSSAAFGKKNLGQLTVVTGIEQEVLTGS